MADASWATSSATRKSMQANRSRDTKPELRLRRALHAMGLRYRVCARPLPEVRRTVDIVFPRVKIAVEVRGCFWHGCPEHYRAPSANGTYWAEKVQRNMRRDADTASRLAEAGWTLTVVWEHEDLDAAAQSIAQQVRTRKDTDS
ncbi:DNA mismatch endonuclease (patch repair protein) [Saccharothrix coeruleofusca]|uniref:very short patch repair endonuclease n=1 Tax=Saccharothrix coeruleofusca TaxID=33919 RepID=UPI001AE1C505|nr:very short patch repair endonuclease [Saccharothrix coeruleofusca]MBP2340491.1 DNA mismatch endonuclease (patch repair protein) [Saccharothrix coeruleofusca]